MKAIKNHILSSIFDAASQPLNIEGITAINQLLIEASAPFPGVIPAGFSFQYIPEDLSGNFSKFFLHTKLSDPWPLDHKIFCGGGLTVEAAYKDLLAQLCKWFEHLNLSSEAQTENAA